jgi:hypothetical protein
MYQSTRIITKTNVRTTDAPATSECSFHVMDFSQPTICAILLRFVYLQHLVHNKKETIGSVNQEIMHVLNEVVTGALQQPILSE